MTNAEKVLKTHKLVDDLIDFLKENDLHYRIFICHKKEGFENTDLDDEEEIASLASHILRAAKTRNTSFEEVISKVINLITRFQETEANKND